jgi:hypothetical protein
MKQKSNKNYVKLVVFSVFIILLATSANSAVINKGSLVNETPPAGPTMYEEFYEWIDEFDNEQKIDNTKSWGYEVSGGVAKMKNTYSVWDDPDWTRMKVITVTNSGGSLTNYAVNFEVIYDSNMQSDYDDIRFKHEDTPTNFLKYWIEDYDTSSASVWVKVPSLPSGSSKMYLFYGNPSAISESNFGDTFTDWDLQYANDEQITLHANNEGGWDPDVSHGSGKFLVAWEEGPAYWPPYSWGFKQEIRASIYVPGTDDPVVFDKRIYKDSTTYFRNENPSIAYSDSKWFVAWENYATTANPDASTMDIMGRTVQKSGSDLSLGTAYDICAESNCQADPKVVYDSVNDKFMVIWEDARSGMTDYDLYARFINADTGAPTGSEITISDDANSQCEPWAAFDPDNEQYMIVWEEGDSPNVGPFKIMGGIFDEDLSEITTFTVAEPSDPDNVDYNFPCVSYDEDSERYLVTWNDGDISDGDWHGNVWGKIYDTSGNVKVSQFQIKNGNFVRTDIAPYLSKAFIVTFDNGAKIYGRLVSSEGDIIGSDIEISGYPNCDADWANIDTDGTNIFVAWEDLRVEYPFPYDDVYPDAFGNCVKLNIPDGSDISYSFGEEKELILDARITSDPIEPDNLESWHDFQVEYENTITFDILNEAGTVVLIEDISHGQSLASIDPVLHPAIRVRADFGRTDPSYTPTLDWWKVRYVGSDEEPPRTWVDYIDGVKGLNDWYTSESVVVWLIAEDLPPDTGSGVDVTYYTLNYGTQEIYNENTGIILTTYAPDWMGIWKVNFWSVDKKGNPEDKSKPENTIEIKIDAEPPYIVITEPVNEQKVKTPFYVRADASDNAEIAWVEFDIEPFGERPGLPIKDYTPPWEWRCNEDPIAHETEGGPQAAGINVMVRAQVFDSSGQTWIHEVWVHITNWGSRVRQIFNFRNILERFNLGFEIGNKLNVEVPEPQNADSAKFVATKVFTRGQTTLWDNDFSNGVSASFNIPTGLYKIMMTSYRDGEEISSDLVSRILYLKR